LIKGARCLTGLVHSYILVEYLKQVLPEMTAASIVAVEKETIKLPISADNKTTILLNVEDAVKDLISILSKKGIVEGVDIDAGKLAELPTSMTGVVVHYLVKGLKDDFNIEFAEKPVSLKVRATSNYDRKVQGKKRLLTKEQKNELLAKMQMSYYENDIVNGVLSMDDAMQSLKDAFEKKKEYEEMGYVLPAKKTESPYWMS